MKMKIFSCLLKNRFTIPMEKSKDFILSKLLIFFFLAIGANNLSAAAISWDGGGGDGNWFTATNWSGDVLPGAADDVTISSAGTVTFGSSATIKSLRVNSSTLTLSASGILTISGSTTDGIRTSNGHINNSGTIKIDNIAHYGINPGGNGTITNSNTIEIGKNGSIGLVGLYMKSSNFNNTASGMLTIDHTLVTPACLLDNQSTFTNAGTFEIGQNHQIVGDGISKEGDNDLVNTGTMRIDRCTTNGMLIVGKFENHHICEIGKNFWVGSVGIKQFNNSTLDNKLGAVLSFDNANNGIQGSSSVNVTNAGTLNFEDLTNAMTSGITVTNTGMAVVGSGHTVQFPGVFDNNVGGTFTNNGTFNNTGTFNQSGTFTNNSTFKNTTGTFNQSGTFTNASGSFIEPGNSPGTLTITGDMSLGSSTLVAEINGTTASSQYDVLNITATGTIVNGSSKLSLVFGYTAAVNDAFDIITTGTLSGTFAMSDISFSGGDVLGVSVTYPGGGVVRVTVTSILPVELVKFEAVNKHEDVLLLWQTASETNNEGFEIQRSTDGSTWSNIAFINGHGATHSTQSYTFTDERPLSGINYYRLKQMDFDGQFEYSHIVSVEMRKGSQSISLFPNPSKGSVTFSLDTDYSGEATLKVFDLMGRAVKTSNLLLEGGPFTTDLDLSNLVAGMYLIEVEMGRQQWQKQLIVE